MKRIGLFVLAITAAAGCGCQSGSKQQSAGAPVNRACPMMLEHDVPARNPATVSFKGKTVGFCCPDCIGEWERLSDAKKDRLLKDAMASR